MFEWGFDADMLDAKMVDADRVAGRLAESGDGRKTHESVTADDVRAGVARLAGAGHDLCDAQRVDLLTALEELKAAAAAAQARVTVDLEASQLAVQAAAGVPARERGRGIGAQVALARRESAARGSRHLGLAKALVHELPQTMRLLTAGHVSEWRATLVARETACLPVEERREVDRRLGPDLVHLGDRAVVQAARALAALLDPAAVVARAARAEAERAVWLRPAPDAMTYLTALLPVAQGVAAFAALDRAAARATATGEQADTEGHLRSRGQLMADALVERLTGQACAEAVPVEVQLVMPAETLAGLGHEPAELFDGFTRHAPMAAATARALLATSTDADAQVWVRRLFTAPGGGELVALDSRRRHFPAGLRRMLRLRDQTCRTPWCDAPIRHDDHVRPVAFGGATSAANGQGLCESCNHAKEAPGWSAEVVADGLAGSPHQVRWRTPTGHEHHGTAPPVLAGRRMAVSGPRPRRTATGARAG